MLLAAIAILLPVILILSLAVAVIGKKRRLAVAAQRYERLNAGACPACGTPLPGPLFAGPKSGYVVQCAGLGGCAVIIEIPHWRVAPAGMDIIRRRERHAELRAAGYSEVEIAEFDDDET